MIRSKPETEEAMDCSAEIESLYRALKYIAKNATGAFGRDFVEQEAELFKDRGFFTERSFTKLEKYMDKRVVRGLKTKAKLMGVVREQET